LLILRLIALLLISLIMLTGCIIVPKINKSYENFEPKIMVTITTDFTEIRKAFKNPRIQGLTIWIGDTCYIYTPPLRDVYDDKSMCIAGHELFHCIYGHFHDKNHADSCN